MGRRPLYLRCLAGILGLFAGCDGESVECGDGTIEQEGTCVAVDTDEASTVGDDSDESTTGAASDSGGSDDSASAGSSGSSSSGGSATDEGPSATMSGGTGPGIDPDGPYAPCLSGSDVECPTGESCYDDYAVCTGSCQEDAGCPTPTSGNAVQVCRPNFDSETNRCMISCSNGLTCPDGMTCGPGDLCTFAIE